MDFKVLDEDRKQTWYGSWIDLLGDSSEESLINAKDVLRAHFDITRDALAIKNICLSKEDMQFIHRPGESIGWKAPATSWENL